jgi:hypothetical protein
MLHFVNVRKYEFFWGEGTYIFFIKASKSSPMQTRVKISNIGLEMVVHACNPSYSGGRDPEDNSSKQSKKLLRPHLISTKKWV